MSEANIISPILRLVRFPNLIVVALTQWLVYYQVILPALQSNGLEGVLVPWKFCEIVLVTLMISASGYIVNDIQDSRLDEINRPGTNPVSLIGRAPVIWAYSMILLGGYLVSLLLAYRLGERNLVWIFPLSIGLLSVYSSNVKRIPFLGNVLVALFCAGVPGILLLAERQQLSALLETAPEVAQRVFGISLLFMLFAFLATMFRELVKDLEDLDGDAKVGRRTAPVILGTEKAKLLAATFGGAVILALLLPVFLRWNALLTSPMLILGGVLITLMSGLLWLLFRAQTPADYRRLSLFLKFYLLGGIALLVFF